MTTPPETSQRWLDRAAPVGVLVALATAELANILSTATLFGGMNALLVRFKDPILVGWMITSFFLVAAASAPLGGRLGDMFGRRRVLIGILLITAAGAVVCATAASPPMIIVGRVLQGVSGAALPLSVGLVWEHFSKERAPIGVNVLFATAAVFGGGGGILIGGLIADRTSWNMLFWSHAVVALIATAALAILVPQGRRTRQEDANRARTQRLDWLGGLLFSPAIAGMLYAIAIARTHGWTAWQPLVCLIGSMSVLAIWARHEYRRPDPLLNVRLLVDRRILLVNLGTLVLCVSSNQYLQVLSTLLQQPRDTLAGFGMAASKSGIAFFAVSFLAFAAVPLGVALVRRRGPAFGIVAVSAALALSWAALMIFPKVLAMALATVGMVNLATVMFSGFCTVVLMDASPPGRVSEVSGMNAVVRQTFNGVGAQTVAFVFGSYTVVSGGSKYPSAFAYTLVFGILAAASLTCLLIGALLQLERRRDARPAI